MALNIWSKSCCRLFDQHTQQLACDPNREIIKVLVNNFNYSLRESKTRHLPKKKNCETRSRKEKNKVSLSFATKNQRYAKTKCKKTNYCKLNRVQNSFGSQVFAMISDWKQLNLTTTALTFLDHRATKFMEKKLSNRTGKLKVILKLIRNVSSC